MGTLDGKVALVTGSGRGIGREIALKFAREGARVVVNDLDSEPAETTAADIRAEGGQAVVCAGSVAEDGFAERFVQSAIDRFGGLDIIVNNAGYTWDTVIQKMTDEQWEAVLDIHLKAPFRILRAAQPFIKANPTDYHRKVVNISSSSGVFGNAGQANYAAAKSGVVGLTKAMAKEWGRYKVNVNAVAYGFIRTRMTAAIDQDATMHIDGRDIKYGVQAERLALDHALEAGAVIVGDGGSQAVLGDAHHVAHALLEAAEFAAIAYRSAHLLGEFGHDFLVHRQHGVEELQDIGAAFLDGEPAPFLLGLAGRGQRRVDLGGTGGRATHQLLAVDGRDTDDVGHD